MTQLTKLTIACLAAACASAEVPDDWVFRYAGNHWHNWAAEYKRARMWDEVIDDTRTKDIDYNIAQVFDLTSNNTTCIERDERRNDQGEKLFHQTGVVAPFRWEAFQNHSYTGLFQTGDDYGLMRLSDSNILVDGLNSSNPSVALKLFVNGQRSVNLMFSVGFTQTEGLDFFPHDDMTPHNHLPFSTHPLVPNKEDHACDWETKVRKVRDATHLPFSTGTGHVATMKMDGDEEDAPWFPYELQLMINPDAHTEYTDGDDPLDYLTNLQVPEDEPLFTVWARDMPDDDTLTPIGEIYLDDMFSRSRFGDTRMFFQHENFNRDIKKLRDSEDEALVERGQAWMDAENARQGGSAWKQQLLKWEDGDYETPDMLGDPAWGSTYQEVYENSVLGHINDHECPFAWMFEAMPHLSQD